VRILGIGCPRRFLSAARIVATTSWDSCRI
jgi:hypothetical protein